MAFTSGEKQPRVLLADDDEGIQTAITRLLSLSCDVVGCVGDIRSLFDTTAALHPDIVLLDFSLPGGLDGLEVCRRLKAMAPQVKVIAFTATDDADLRQMAHQAGVSAFVWKLHAATDLLTTIHAVAEPTGGSGGGTRT
jgi:DNA-binding NarL/FixJ family response regulator